MGFQRAPSKNSGAKIIIKSEKTENPMEKVKKFIFFLDKKLRM